jgi:hypothetical protein
MSNIFISIMIVITIILLTMLISIVYANFIDKNQDMDDDLFKDGE